MSNSLDLVMGGVAFIPVFGWAVSGTYFIANITTELISEALEIIYREPLQIQMQHGNLGKYWLWAFLIIHSIGFVIFTNEKRIQQPR